MQFSVSLTNLVYPSNEKGSTSSSPTFWWRVYNADGNSFDCGHSSNDMLQRGVTYETFSTQNSIFAFMRIDGFHRKRQFQAEEIFLIPSVLNTSPPPPSSSSPPHENVTFTFDCQTGQCIPSHFVIRVTNETPCCLQVALAESSAIPTNVPPQNATREIVMESAFYLRRPNKPKVVLKANRKGSTTEEILLNIYNVTNGDSITVYYDDELGYIQKPLICPIPVDDIPIRCINRSREDARITVIEDETGGFHRVSAEANGEPFIIWLPWHPNSIEWSTQSVPRFEEPYKSGMTLTIRSPAAIEACRVLLEAAYDDGATKRSGGEKLEFVTLLEEAGELERCAGVFANQLIEYWQLPLMTEHDWDQLGIKVGSKIRIQHALRQRGLMSSTIQNMPRNASMQGWIEATNATPTEHFEYDLFISHRHEGGEDLAQAIKLQLQVRFWECSECKTRSTTCAHYDVVLTSR